MLSREERIFSELLLARGLVARDFIDGFERTKAKAGDGPGSQPSLAEAVIDSGEVERAQAEDALEEARAIDAALAPHLAGGTRLGEFLLIREIGRGGMGIVYEAEQPSLGRRVAVKVLPAGAALDERLAIRFLREARAAARLQHPGIVQVFASGRDEGVLFFAMELVEGRSLGEAVAEGPMAPDRAAHIAIEIARALDHAHEAGLVHRDVKPENILIASNGRARLTDFGLVHETVPSSFTLPHHVLGTPAYISPEQARGEAVDRRSDIYGLGAVLYTLLGGKPPYAGEVPSLVLSRVLSGPPPPVRLLRPGLPPGLAAICERAMARTPEGRYATAAELAEELEAFERGEAPAAVVAPRRSRRLGKVGWLVGAVCAAAIVAAGVLIAAISGRRDAAEAPGAPGAVASGGGSGGVTIFDSTTVPPWNGYTSDPYQAEVGVKFRSDTCGYVTALRFLKDKRSSGSHVGHLWTGAGALLATAVFSGETAEGWQEAGLMSPVRIVPSVTYVASYHVGAGGGYYQQPLAFQAAGVDRPPLHALKAGIDGCNGVFKFGPPRDVGGFPDQCTDESNFFVDVVFREVDCGGAMDPAFVLVNASTGSKTWPAFSPDGKLLAYSVCSDGACASWIQDLATGEISKLAAGRSGPAFAPDGKGIAFGTAEGVEVLAFDGRTIDERSARRLGAPFSAARPAWSPRSGAVVFSEDGAAAAKSGGSGIWVGDPTARRARKLEDIDARALAYSPRGSRIAFISRAGGAADLWTIAPDGGDAVRLTNDDATDWSPFWSPDGRRIYFGSDTGGTPRLWSVDVDEASGLPIGSPSPALTVGFPAGFYAALSADGGKLAIVSEEDPGRLFRLPFDPVSGKLTAPPAALPRLPGGAMHPQLSPDGKHLVYVVALENDLAVIDADGSGEPRQLTNDEFRDQAPRWSPDGGCIAFSSNRRGESEVWTIRLDGTDLRQITRTATGDAGSPVWSPDGTRIAYSVDRRSAHVISTQAGGSDLPPETLPSYGSEEPFEPWSWSPDGSTLAGSIDGVGVILYSIPDRSYRRITEFGGHPVWFGDGRKLLFVGDRRIYMVDRDGGAPREVYAAAPAALRPYLSVSGDGRSIFTSLSAPSEAIWIADLTNDGASRKPASRAPADRR